MDVFSEIAQDPAPRKRPAATIVSINGNRFVSGLLWQALTRPRGYMKEAKEIGKREGLDIVAIRDTAEVKQAGFVSKADGAYKGMYSLAAALAGQLGDTWIGAFKLPDDRYAMVAVDSGAIIPAIRTLFRSSYGESSLGALLTLKTISLRRPNLSLEELSVISRICSNPLI